MSSDPAVEREGQILLAHLARRHPTDYAIACYRRCRVAAAAADDRLDLLLLRAACRRPWLAAPADAYARLVRPAGGFRRRVVLALAIVENAPDTHGGLHPRQAPRITAWVALAGCLLVAACRIAAGIVCFGPVHLALWARRERSA